MEKKNNGTERERKKINMVCEYLVFIFEHHIIFDKVYLFIYYYIKTIRFH